MKKRSDGRYKKNVIMSDGTTKQIYGRSIAELNQNVMDVVKAADAGLNIHDNTTVGGWAEEWFKTYKANIRKHTKLSYLNSYNNHIFPQIGTVPLKSVKPIHIQNVMNDAAQYSEDLQRKVLNTMKQIFDTAIMNHLIVFNPCMGIKITAHAKPDKVKYLTPEQQETLLNSIIDPRAKLFVALGIYCGLRREESVGLMWEDICEDKLTVNRAITFIKNQADDDQSLKSKAAHRTIPIPVPLKALLDVYPHKSKYVITNASGGEMSLMAFRRMWEKVTSVVDFHVHSHMLRHSYATSLYRAGIDLKTAQYLLGHSDIKMTAEVYTHIANEQVDDAATKINKIFQQKGSEKVQNPERANDNGDITE